MKIVKLEDLHYVAASHEDQINPQVWKKVLLKRDDLMQGRIQMINWAKLPVGQAFQAHYHEDMEEIFIILTGQARITIDQEIADLKAGDTVITPLGHTHSMANTGNIDIEYIAIGISTETGGKTIVEN